MNASIVAARAFCGRHFRAFGGFVPFLATVAATIGPQGVLSVINALAFTVALVIGASVPLWVHLFVRPQAVRPEPRQWRWGSTIGLLTLASLGLAEREVSGALITGTLLINGYYAVGKAGCNRVGCCHAVPYKVVNNSISLPAFERNAATVTFCAIIFLAYCSAWQAVILIGLTCHLMLRSFSYWARGLRFDAARPTKFPDVVVMSIAAAALAVG